MTVTHFKKIILIAIAVVGLGFINTPYASPVRSQADIQYVGNSDNLPVFQLALNNSEKNVYAVTIRNQGNRILLHEKLKGKAIQRRYKLMAGDFNLIDGTTIEVTNKTTRETILYTIHGNTVVADYVSDFKNLMSLIATH